jgi:hypothetical protein
VQTDRFRTPNERVRRVMGYERTNAITPLGLFFRFQNSQAHGGMCCNLPDR